MTRAGGVTPPRKLETHSIDWVPTAERRGRARDLGPVWFMANVNITAVATGAAVASLGGSLGWTLLATAVGTAFGTVFMALHSVQGPRLGLPQLIQSRAQFGYLGAAITVWIVALVMFLAYNVVNTVLAAQSLAALVGLPVELGYLTVAVTAAVLAAYGYRWIHWVAKLLALPLIAALALATISAVRQVPAAPLTEGGFELAPFASTVVIVAGFQIGWSPYVSDYSRYLPEDVSSRATIGWTYFPSLVSAVWVFSLGVLLTHGSPGVALVDSLDQAADDVVPGAGWPTLLTLTASLVAIIAVNQYGGMMALTSILDSFRPVRPVQGLRVVAILLMAAVPTAVAWDVGLEHFNDFYASTLVFLAYAFIPWTAINLTDYYVVHRGHYRIDDFFDRHGPYGRWGWRGTTAYVVGLASMVPFMVTAPFVGPVAHHLGAVDIAIVPGLGVSALLYLAIANVRHDVGESTSPS